MIAAACPGCNRPLTGRNSRLCAACLRGLKINAPSFTQRPQRAVVRYCPCGLRLGSSSRATSPLCRDCRKGYPTTPKVRRAMFLAGIVGTGRGLSLPGSAERLAVLIRRCEDGLPLWRRDDLTAFKAKD